MLVIPSTSIWTMSVSLNPPYLRKLRSPSAFSKYRVSKSGGILVIDRVMIHSQYSAQQLVKNRQQTLHMWASSPYNLRVDK